MRWLTALLLFIATAAHAVSFPSSIYSFTLTKHCVVGTPNDWRSCSTNGDCGVGGVCLEAYTPEDFDALAAEVHAIQVFVGTNGQMLVLRSNFNTASEVRALLESQNEWTGTGAMMFNSNPTVDKLKPVGYTIAGLPSAGSATGSWYYVTNSNGTCTGAATPGQKVICVDLGTGNGYAVVGGSGQGASGDQVYVNGAAMTGVDMMNTSTITVARTVGGGAGGADRATFSVVNSSLTTTHLASSAKTGTQAKLVTSTGGFTGGTCAQWNSSGDLVSSGGSCGGTGGGGDLTFLHGGAAGGSSLAEGGSCLISTIKFHQDLFSLWDEGGGVGRVETHRTGGGTYHVSASADAITDNRIGVWQSGNLTSMKDVRLDKPAYSPFLTLPHGLRQVSSEYYSVPRYWAPSTHYDVGDQVQFFPGGHNKWVATQAGTSGPDVPWATASNVNGIPRVRTPRTQYKTGDRVTSLVVGWAPAPGGGYGPMRWRVWGGTEGCGGLNAAGNDCCTTSTTQSPNWTSCQTNNCNLTDGTCTLTCSDNSCTLPNAAPPQLSVTDGGVIWEHVLHPVGGYAQFFGQWQIGGNNGIAPINMEDEYFGQHSIVSGLVDNQRGAIFGDVGQSGRGSYNTLYNIPQTNMRFATFDESPRGGTPSILLSSSHDYAGAKTITMLRAQAGDHGSGEPRMDQPQFGPRLFATTGDHPLSAGCMWFALSWESKIDGGRTPPGYFMPIYLNGTTQTGVNIDIPGTCPSQAANAVLWAGGMGGTCGYNRPNSMMRTRTIACSAFNAGTCDGTTTTGCEVSHWDWDDIFGETEVPFSVNLTSPIYWEAHAVPGASGRWTANGTHTLAGSNGNIMPSANQQNGFHYMLQTADGHENPWPGAVCTGVGTPMACCSGNLDPDNACPAWTCQSAASEPVWNNQPGGLTTDGTCVWKWAGREPAMQIWKSSFEWEPQDTWQLREGSNDLNGDRVIAGIENDGDFYWVKYTSSTENRYQSSKSVVIHRALTNGGGIDFGPGGYNAPPDVSLYRTGANSLTVQQPGGGAANLTITGNVNIQGTCTGCGGAGSGDNIFVKAEPMADANFIDTASITVTFNHTPDPDTVSMQVANDGITPDMLKVGGSVGQCPYKASSSAMGWQTCGGGGVSWSGGAYQIAKGASSSALEGNNNFTYDGGSLAQLGFSSTGSYARFGFWRLHTGSPHSPYPANADVIGDLLYGGTGALSITPLGARIRVTAAEDWSASTAASVIQLWATQSGSTSPASGLDVGYSWAKLTSTSGEWQIGTGWKLARGTIVGDRPTRANFTNSANRTYAIGATTWTSGSAAVAFAGTTKWLPACYMSGFSDTWFAACTLPPTATVYGFDCALRNPLSSGSYTVGLYQGSSGSQTLLGDTCTIDSTHRDCSSFGPWTGGTGTDLGLDYKVTANSPNPSTEGYVSCQMLWLPETW